MNQVNPMNLLQSSKAPKTKWDHLKVIIMEYSNNVSDEVASDAYMVILGEMHRLEQMLDDTLIQQMQEQLNEFNHQTIVRLTEENKRQSVEIQRLKRELARASFRVVGSDTPAV